MTAQLEFDNYSPSVLRLILAKAQEWNCTPVQAITRLLDQLAAANEKKGVA